VTAETERPLRADARRNRERIMAAAGELCARLGHEAQMEEIAAHAGLGLGTIYRHFPGKQALLTAMVGARVEAMADLARTAEQVADPVAAFETLVRSYLEAADGDAAFQLALMGSRNIDWQRIEPEKAEFDGIADRIIRRAVASGGVRSDLTVLDFHHLTCGVISSMYFKRGGRSDWRRHLDLSLDGVRSGRAVV
jgi:AcrR family transcriptional regulator